MTDSGVPFLLGGGYALRHYTGRVRVTADMDAFVRRGDAERLVSAMAAAGFETEMTFPHWLGKARRDGECIDLIWSSGNGVCAVDDEWFRHGEPATILDVPVILSPPEEMVWSKAFVMERERYDGADVAHVIRACAPRLDWDRLMARFGPNWRVFLSHLTLFGFIYPGARDSIPVAVMLELSRRLVEESQERPLDRRLCRGTLLSREQYLTDVIDWGYGDARLFPVGSMSPEDVALWTAAIRRR